MKAKRMRIFLHLLIALMMMTGSLFGCASKDKNLSENDKIQNSFQNRICISMIRHWIAWVYQIVLCSQTSMVRFAT